MRRGDEGFAIYFAWSQKSSKHIDENTYQAWEEIQSSPPTRTGVEKIFKIARENGWVRKLRATEPTYPAEGHSDADAARNEIRKIACDFFSRVAVPESERNVWIDHYFETRDPDWPMVWAMRVTTAGGKTQITIEELAKWMRTVVLKGPIVYAVPHHKLSPEIVERFAEHGINARIFHGREHDDPEQFDPDKSKDAQIKMCLDLVKVGMAMQVQADITKTCCKDGKKRCQFFDKPCGYWRQQIGGEEVQVWIVASDILFLTHKAFGEPAAVIIDEAFWQKGLRIDDDKYSLPLDTLRRKKRGRINLEDEADVRNAGREGLGKALRQQESNVERRHLELLTPEHCAEGIRLEWKLVKALMHKLALEPGRKAKIKPKDIKDIREARLIIKIWEEVRRLLNDPATTVSGRLRLKQDDKGRRCVAWRGVEPIKPQFWVPTLQLDATLPDQSVLEIYHPQVEVVGDIKVAMPPHVHVRQVLRAPTTSGKLDNKKHLEEIRRYIMQRWIETGRQRTLVIGQMKVEEWLGSSELPSDIHVGHFNSITGLDAYRDVRLLILAGRTAPPPFAIECQAAVLTGRMPTTRCPSNQWGFTWYPQPIRGIRLRNGRGVETKCDEHPDAFVESVRWLIHEAELIQGIGRARGIHRKPDEPLDIDLLFNTCLPITVDEVVPWRAPSLLVEIAELGVVLTAPVDLVKLWKKLWPDVKAAYRTVQEGVPVLPGFSPITYQRAGPKMKKRTGFFDQTLIPDPMGWLQEHLGPLV